MTGCFTSGNGALSSLVGGAQGGTASNIASSVAGAVANTGTLENILSSFLGKAALNESTLYGTWNYRGVDVAFDSDNLLIGAYFTTMARTWYVLQSACVRQKG